MRHPRNRRTMSVCSEPMFEFGVNNKGNNNSKQVMCNKINGLDMIYSIRRVTETKYNH